MKTQLTRSTTNKVLAGVAGGIAEAFGWDVTLVRLGFVLLTFLHGGGLLLYLALLIAMPKPGHVSLLDQAVASVWQGEYRLGGAERNRTLGLMLLGLGILMLASIFDLAGPVVALLIIGAGWYLLRQRA